MFDSELTISANTSGLALPERVHAALIRERVGEPLVVQLVLVGQHPVDDLMW